jgi:hypothetical protein
MKTARFTFAVALSVVALMAGGCGGGEEGTRYGGTTTTTETTATATTPTGTTIRGSVGPSFEISVATEDGQSLETLASGSYTLEVDDMASTHSFHLTGPGVDVGTDVGGEGTETFQVELQPATYSFVCDAHPSLNGSFEVSG